MHRMTACVMEIMMVVSVFMYRLVDIIPLLILIIASKNDAAVVEYSCVEASKVSIQCGQIRKMSWIYLKKCCRL